MFAANALQPPQRMTRRSLMSLRLASAEIMMLRMRSGKPTGIARVAQSRFERSILESVILAGPCRNGGELAADDRERHARKAKQFVSMLSARNWNETIMISRVGVRHMTSILLCKHAQSPIFFRLRRAEGSATLRRSNLCLQSGLTP